MRTPEIRCDVYWDDYELRKPDILLFPNDEEASILREINPANLEIKIGDTLGGTETIIESEDIYWESIEPIHYSDEYKPIVARMLLQHFKIKEIYNYNNVNFKNNLRFYLFDSFLLRPLMVIEPFIDGNIKVNISRNIEVQPFNRKIKFDYLFKYKDANATAIEQKQVLVATTEDCPKEKDIHLISDLLDNVLLLKSFAERRKCGFFGYEFFENNSITKEFFFNKVIPKPLKGDEISSTLIDNNLIQQFLTSTILTFNNLSDLEQKKIKEILYLITYEGNSVESSFKNYFSAIESLLSIFSNCTHIIENKQ
jgi:hypothetical protein